MEPTSWDEYEPENRREWDQCPFCVRGLEHTVEQHVQKVKEADEGELRREDALYRQAHFVYETDRL